MSRRTNRHRPSSPFPPMRPARARLIRAAWLDAPPPRRKPRPAPGSIGGLCKLPPARGFSWAKRLPANAPFTGIRGVFLAIAPPGGDRPPPPDASAVSRGLASCSAANPSPIRGLGHSRRSAGASRRPDCAPRCARKSAIRVTNMISLEPRESTAECGQGWPTLIGRAAHLGATSSHDCLIFLALPTGLEPVFSP